MSDDFSYKDYTSREEALRQYNEYQARYAVDIRESDKAIISMVKDLVAKAQGRTLKLLDIGCSTGNLLKHIKHQIPDLNLTGGDLAKSSLVKCRNSTELSGVLFREMDFLSLNSNNEFDIIVANAVTYLFSWHEYSICMEGVFKALRPGGAYITFEWLHPFEHQDITITETTVMHPEGIRISARPIPKVKNMMTDIGFGNIAFHPFEMPFDLPRPGNDEEVVSYTENLEDGRRLTFRGALYQPWCHMIAHKG